MRNRSDARDRAVAILSGAKVRELEAAGLMVVDQQEWIRRQVAIQVMRDVWDQREMDLLGQAIDQLRDV